MKTKLKKVKAQALNSIEVSKLHKPGYMLKFNSYKETNIREVIGTTTIHEIELDEWDLKQLIEQILKAVDRKQEMFQSEMKALRSSLRYHSTDVKLEFYKREA